MNIAVRNGIYYVPPVDTPSNNKNNKDSEKVSNAISKSADKPNSTDGYLLNVVQSQFQSGTPISAAIPGKKSFFEILKTAFFNPQKVNRQKSNTSFNFPSKLNYYKSREIGEHGFYLTIPKEHLSSLEFKLDSAIERTYKSQDIPPKGILVNAKA